MSNFSLENSDSSGSIFAKAGEEKTMFDARLIMVAKSIVHALNFIHFLVFVCSRDTPNTIFHQGLYI